MEKEKRTNVKSKLVNQYCKVLDNKIQAVSREISKTKFQIMNEKSKEIKSDSEVGSEGLSKPKAQEMLFCALCRRNYPQMNPFLNFWVCKGCKSPQDLETFERNINLSNADRKLSNTFEKDAKILNDANLKILKILSDATMGKDSTKDSTKVRKSLKRYNQNRLRQGHYLCVHCGKRDKLDNKRRSAYKFVHQCVTSDYIITLKEERFGNLRKVKEMRIPIAGRERKSQFQIEEIVLEDISQTSSSMDNNDITIKQETGIMLTNTQEAITSTQNIYGIDDNEIRVKQEENPLEIKDEFSEIYGSSNDMSGIELEVTPIQYIDRIDDHNIKVNQASSSEMEKCVTEEFAKIYNSSSSILEIDELKDHKYTNLTTSTNPEPFLIDNTVNAESSNENLISVKGETEAPVYLFINFEEDWVEEC